jgi:hypothetical protein
MSTYQPIMEAVLAFLQAQCGSTFKYYSRRFMTWEAMKESRQSGTQILQPALFLYEGVGMGGGTINFQQAGRTPAKRIIAGSIVVYAQMTGGDTPSGIDATTPGANLLYTLLESIEAAFESQDLNQFGIMTLGRLVQYCWIEGDVHLLVGDIDPDGQGMMVIPVKIMVP